MARRVKKVREKRNLEDAREELQIMAGKYKTLQSGLWKQRGRSVRTIMTWARRLHSLARYSKRYELSLQQLIVDVSVVWARLEEAYNQLPKGKPEKPAWYARKIINDMRLDSLDWLVKFGGEHMVPMEVRMIIEEDLDAQEFVGGGPMSQWGPDKKQV